MTKKQKKSLQQILSLIHISVVTKSMWLLAQNCDSFDQLQQRFYRQVNFDTFYH